MKHHALSFALLLTLPLTVGRAQQEGDSSAAPASADLARKVDAIFAEWDRPDSPGCALVVVQDGRIVYEHGYGSANLDYGLPITPDSVFYVASVSKQFTAACIALLAQEGKLSLDDDVRRHVPELPDYGKTITLRHLVHHTSGLRDYLSLMELAGMPWENVYREQELIDLICRQKALNFPPGDEYLYSNSGYLLMAEIVRRVSGQSMRQYADARIFQPLGMRSTHFHDNRLEVVKDRAVGYTKTDEGGYRMNFLANWDKVGSGGLYSSARDLALWDRNFEDGAVGGCDFLVTQQSRGRLNDGTVLDYAFGLTVGEYNGIRTVGHGGAFQGYRTVFLRFPPARFSVILLANFAEADPTALARQVADLFLADAFHAALERFTGRYWSEELQTTYEVESAQGALRLVRRGSEPEALTSTGRRGAFSASVGELVFSENDQHDVTGFDVSTGRARNARFERTASSPQDANP